MISYIDSTLDFITHSSIPTLGMKIAESDDNGYHYTAMVWYNENVGSTYGAGYDTLVYFVEARNLETNAIQRSSVEAKPVLIEATFRIPFEIMEEIKNFMWEAKYRMGVPRDESSAEDDLMPVKEIWYERTSTKRRFAGAKKKFEVAMANRKDGEGVAVVIGRDTIPSDKYSEATYTAEVMVKAGEEEPFYRITTSSFGVDYEYTDYHFENGELIKGKPVQLVIYGIKEEEPHPEAIIRDIERFEAARIGTGKWI